MNKLLSVMLILSIATVMTGAPSVRIQENSATQTPASTQLTNKDVVDMVKSGLAADIIVAKIKASPSKFDTSPAALSDLKGVGVPDNVILTMVQSETGAPTAVTAVGATPVEVKVADGTEVEIQLKSTASGEQLKVGDIVDFTVLRPVVVNGVMIFDKDASGRARITTAKRAGHWGHAGKLEWAMQDIQAVDGNRVPARFTNRALGDSKGGTVAVAAVATTVLLGPFGLLWGLKKGKPAIIPAGNRYSAFVNGDTAIKGKPVTP